MSYENEDGDIQIPMKKFDSWIEDGLLTYVCTYRDPDRYPNDIGYEDIALYIFESGDERFPVAHGSGFNFRWGARGADARCVQGVGTKVLRISEAEAEAIKYAVNFGGTLEKAKRVLAET